MWEKGKKLITFLRLHFIFIDVMFLIFGKDFGWFKVCLITNFLFCFDSDIAVLNNIGNAEVALIIPVLTMFKAIWERMIWCNVEGLHTKKMKNITTFVFTFNHNNGKNDQVMQMKYKRIIGIHDNCWGMCKKKGICWLEKFPTWMHRNRWWPQFANWGKFHLIVEEKHLI